MTDQQAGAELERLEAEARYHRDRLAIYRARAYGGKLTTPTRLRELQRTSVAAEARLQEGRRRAAAEGSSSSG